MFAMLHDMACTDHDTCWTFSPDLNLCDCFGVETFSDALQHVRLVIEVPQYRACHMEENVPEPFASVTQRRFSPPTNAKSFAPAAHNQMRITSRLKADSQGTLVQDVLVKTFF